MMGFVEFTQFLRPDGQEKVIRRPVTPEIEKLADDLTAVGCKFEIEKLTTGYVSAEVCLYSRIDPGVASRVVPDGPEVPRAIDDLIREAHDRLLGWGYL